MDLRNPIDHLKTNKMSRIKVIDENEAEGRLLEIYSDLLKKRGKIASVHKIQSLRPESIVKHMDLYMEIMYTRSELSRAERELMAVVVSKANNCHYCQIHHAEALNHYWKNNDRIKHLLKGHELAELSEKESLLCSFAERLTTDPSSFNDPHFVEQLKQIKLSDAAILDAVLVVAYFNFVNRIVLSLAVEIEHQTDGFHY
jgi:uncharacterized peroxidase-related enzyme